MPCMITRKTCKLAHRFRVQIRHFFKNNHVFLDLTHVIWHKDFAVTITKHLPHALCDITFYFMQNLQKTSQEHLQNNHEICPIKFICNHVFNIVSYCAKSIHSTHKLAPIFTGKIRKTTLQKIT